MTNPNGKTFSKEELHPLFQNALRLCVRSYDGKHGDAANVYPHEIRHTVYDKTDHLTYITTFLDGIHYICFQGSNEKQDWYRNFDAEFFDIEDEMKVHEGFIQHINKFDIQLEKELERIRFSLDDFKAIVICGHSLGAAIATLFCTELLAERYPQFIPHTVCITAGSPRVGNSYYKEYFNRNFPNSYRFVYGGDVVTRVPKFFFYHVGKEIKLGKKRFFARFSDHEPKKYLDAVTKGGYSVE